MGPLRGNDGRQLEQMGGGPWGLHPESKYFCLDDEGVQPLDNPQSRYVCLPRQHKVEKFCFKVATLPSHQGGCIKMPFGRFSSHICQPPMDHNTPMVTQIKTTPSFEMFNNMPPVGFCTMVAPINKATYTTDPCLGNPTSSRNVFQLHESVYAHAKVAPSLHSVIRAKLEQSEMHSENVKDYLGQNLSINTYDSAFRILWGILKSRGVNPGEASCDQIASAIIELHKASASQARNAYSGVLLIPGFSSMRFMSVLLPYKKIWNTNTEKYASFWDPTPLLERLLSEKFDWNMAQEVRDRFILVSRILCLYRSVDLSRMLRNISFVGGPIHPN